MAQPTKKRKFLSLEDKARIIAEAESGKKKANIAEDFIGAHDDDVAMALLTECENRVAPLLTAKRKQAKLTDFWH